MPSVSRARRSGGWIRRQVRPSGKTAGRDAVPASASRPTSPAKLGDMAMQAPVSSRTAIGAFMAANKARAIASAEASDRGACSSSALMIDNRLALMTIHPRLYAPFAG